MPTIVCNVAALVVASLFYTWRAYYLTRLQRHRSLRDRIACMLWVMAFMDEPGVDSKESLPEMGLTVLQT